MGKVLVDSCIFIDIFRGNKQLYQDLLELDISISTIVYMELIQGSRDKIELTKIDNFLKKFQIIPINQATSNISMELMKKFSISYGLLIPDALIAGTAIIKELPLWTFNHKDFKFIDDIVLFKAAEKDDL